MDEDIINAIENDEINDLNVTLAVTVEQESHEKSDSDVSFEYGYELLPSDDPDEEQEMSGVIEPNEYETRKRESFEAFDRKYEEELNKALEDVPTNKDIIFNEGDEDYIKLIMTKFNPTEKR